MDVQFSGAVDFAPLFNTPSLGAAKPKASFGMAGNNALLSANIAILGPANALTEASAFGADGGAFDTISNGIGGTVDLWA